MTHPNKKKTNKKQLSGLQKKNLVRSRKTYSENLP